MVHIQQLIVGWNIQNAVHALCMDKLTELLKICYLLDISPNTKTTQKNNSFLGLGQLLIFIRNYQRKFGNAVNNMTLRLNQSRNACVRDVIDSKPNIYRIPSNTRVNDGNNVIE